MSELILTRTDALELTERAARHTTMPYRAPELFEGGIGMRPGPNVTLDHGKCDSWSLGCVLFAVMYGTSPFEMDFNKNTDWS